MTQSLLQDADRLFDARRYADARPVYLQAAEMATASGDRSTATEAYAMAARTHLIVDEKEQGRPWLAKAAETASPDDALGWSDFELGHIARTRDQLHQALSHLLIAEEQLRQADMPRWDPSRYDDLVAQIAQLRTVCPP